MPRVTRAALRTNAIFDEELNLAAATSLPLTPSKERSVLGEVDGNLAEQVKCLGELDDLVKAGKAQKKSKTTRKAKKITKRREDPPNVEVMEDDNQSTTSSAVEEACDSLLKPTVGEVYQTPMHAHDRPMTPPSAAVKALKTILTPRSKTPRFDPQVHVSTEKLDADIKGEKEDSFIEKIESRTPAAMTRTEPCKDVQANGDCDTKEKKNDSFVEQIIARSPAKPVVRIEDSVEAIDALEEAIEKIGESLPAVEEKLRSPPKLSKQNTKIQTSARKPASLATLTPGKSYHDRKSFEGPRTAQKSATSSKNKLSSTPRVLSTKAPTSTKPTVKRSSRTSMTVTKVTNLKSSTPADLAQPAMESTNIPSEANRKTSNIGAKRLSSITKAPFIPTKSTKPLTRSSFVLPGEAIAQKLKQQREERLKSDEENKPQARTFKARPAPNFTAPVVKPTTASKARVSMAKTDAATKTSALAKDNAPTIQPLRRQSSAETNKRQSTLMNAKRSTPAVANVSAIRKSIVAKITSPEDVTPAVGATRQTSRGKEVFQRGRLEKEEKERVQKEKEEAARKARVDAAERGRIASREWAEKQKAKKLVGKAASVGTEALTVA